MARKPVVKKPVSGLMQERIGEAKTRPYKGTRGGAVTKTGKPRGRLNTARTADVYKMSQEGRSMSRAVATTEKAGAKYALGEAPRLLNGPAKAASGRMAGRVGAALTGPIGLAAFELATSSTELNKGELRSGKAAVKEPLMKGNNKYGKPIGPQRFAAGASFPKGKGTASLPAKSSYSGYGAPMSKAKPVVQGVKPKPGNQIAQAKANAAQKKAAGVTPTFVKVRPPEISAAKPSPKAIVQRQTKYERDVSSDIGKKMKRPSGSILGLFRKSR